jgi:hypothetical protein
VAAAILLATGAAVALAAGDSVFQPTEAGNVHSFFRNGAALAAIHSDSVFTLAEIEPISIGNTPYARLWLLVENRSTKPMLFEPLRCVALRVESTQSPRKGFPAYKADLTPTSPTTILAKISDTQAMSAILGSIGAALEASAQRPTTASTTNSTDFNRTTTTINDTELKQRAVLDRRATQAAARDDWYEAFKGSISQGVLRRNTLFPGEGVNGYIYFKAPGSQPSQPTRRYVVTLRMTEGDQVVSFEPIEGE